MGSGLSGKALQGQTRCTGLPFDIRPGGATRWGGGKKKSSKVLIAFEKCQQPTHASLAIRKRGSSLKGVLVA